MTMTSSQKLQNLQRNKLKIRNFLRKFGMPKLCFAESGDRSSRMINNVDLDNLCFQNSHGKDAYFYVNSGGTKAEEVTQINAAYVDLDVGKDENKQYFTAAIVNKKKKIILDKINSFPVKPSFVVETRNGYHVYWLIKNLKLGNVVTKRNELVNRWKQLEYKLLNYFKDVGADKWVIRLNQILRVPYSYWYKDWSNVKDLHQTAIVRAGSEVYTLNQLENLFSKYTLGAMSYGDRTNFNQNNSSLPWAQFHQAVKNGTSEEAAFKEIIASKPKSLVPNINTEKEGVYLVHDVCMATLKEELKAAKKQRKKPLKTELLDLLNFLKNDYFDDPIYKKTNEYIESIRQRVESEL